jgi:hypothetical protein
MQPFEYDIAVKANSQNEADKKMKALVTILNKLSTEELIKVSEVVSNPLQLAIIKSKLL